MIPSSIETILSVLHHDLVFLNFRGQNRHPWSYLRIWFYLLRYCYHLMKWRTFSFHLIYFDLLFRLYYPEEFLIAFDRSDLLLLRLRFVETPWRHAQVSISKPFPLIRSRNSRDSSTSFRRYNRSNPSIILLIISWCQSNGSLLLHGPLCPLILKTPLIVFAINRLFYRCCTLISNSLLLLRLLYLLYDLLLLCYSLSYIPILKCARRLLSLRLLLTFYKIRILLLSWISWFLL